MTISSAENQMPPVDMVYRLFVADKERKAPTTGGFVSGYHNKEHTCKLETEREKATVYTSLRAVKQAYSYHYKNPAGRYEARIEAYTVTLASTEYLPAGT